MTLLELLGGAVSGGFLTEIVRYAATRTRGEEPKSEPKRETKTESPRREVGGLSWFWKELSRERGAWKVVESDAHALAERIAKLEGKEEAPSSRKRGT